MNDFTPKYILIQEHIIGKINNGEYRIGDKIPSEDQLAKLFKVSRITSNKAISDLEIIGLVERIRGKGTFVRTDVTSNNSFNHVLTKSYRISSEITEENTHELLEIERVKSNSYISEYLKIKKGEPVYNIIRLMVNNNEPIGIDYSYIPVSILRNDSLDVDLIAKSYIHDYLRTYEAKHPKHLHVHIGARLPDANEQNLLNIKLDSPVIVWESLVVDESNNPIALSITSARPDRYRPFINFEL
jgi:DNA-binding GntR family transcriptional regulator